MCHVLIIEDNGVIAHDLADVAFDAGATSVDIAASPAQALAHAVTCLPSIILSDARIVDGTGPQAVAAIRGRLGEIPVIFITSDAEGCSGTMCSAVLLKPIVKQQLIDVFRSAMTLKAAIGVSPE